MDRRQLLCGLGMSALVGCAGNSFDYRFKLTIVVDTPEGRHTGSSVF
jgi:hypothetical protein